MVIKLLVIIALAGVLTGCGRANEGKEPGLEQADKTFQQITQEVAKNMMEQENIIILDVREEYEYADGHIQDAVLLPLGSIKKEAETMIPDKNTVLLVYCRSGNRSKAASADLIDLGYQNVYEFGGIIDWPYEIVK